MDFEVAEKNKGFSAITGDSFRFGLMRSVATSGPVCLRTGNLRKGKET